MDVGTVLSVAQTLFAALQCSELRDIFSVLGYQSELDSFKNTVNTIKAVLLDAEAKADHEELPSQAQLLIEELKDAIYDADDLLDEFVTLAERRHQKLFKEGAVSEVSEKVRRFFSRIKDLPAAYTMSKGVKGIRKKLDAIADNHNNFRFKLDSQPIRKRREQTCSYVYAQDIIGRDTERDNIVGMLLDADVRHDVSFLTIVGMGGLGKTTLAQLIYNDERIRTEFPTRLWACVADEDPNHLDVTAVLVKILESITGRKNDESTTDLVQRRVREKLAVKKYLLVLDDVWNENRYDWEKLENFLKSASKGSWVVVTTRSSNTAKIVEDGYLYELQGLLDEDSWNLFEMAAFGKKEGEANPPEVVEIGKEIVKKCANVPLAIRVVGSLLYGQGINKWLSFEKNELSEVSPKKNNLFAILKFSYHLLDSPLKSCFSYCAVFPKDHRIEKEMLIQLWMAQGFIVPLEKGQSIEDAGEEYFLILLRRCFFQDVKKDKDGEIISFKLHDLMHDVAQDVSKKEICAADCVTGDLDKQIRHLSVTKHTGTVTSFTKSKVRTLLYLCWRKEGLSVGTLLDNWMNLRALDLSDSGIVSLPDQIRKLVHLRYLDLSRNYKMKVLPKSFTKLHNLEILILKSCHDLIQLPDDFCKLVKLRCLDLENCHGFTHMPAGMGNLSCLHKLTMFALDFSNPGYGDLLKGLQVLKEIKGQLEFNIYCYEDVTYEKGNISEGGYLKNKPYLNGIKFVFVPTKGVRGYKETLMEDMQPHPNLRRLSLCWYNGEKLPSWVRGDNLTTSLPNLVDIHLTECNGLEYIPSFGKLPHLRYLKVEWLRNLKYMEENRNSKEVGTRFGTVEDSIFFPSLKVLELMGLYMLKGWWREEEEGVEDDDYDDKEKKEEDSSSSSSRSRRRQSEESLSFPLLSSLVIRDCPGLTSIITVANVEEVELKDINEKLRLSLRGTSEDEQNPSKLRKVTMNNVRCLKTVLPMEALHCLTELNIEFDNKVESLEQVGEVWRSCCSSSLRILKFYNCHNLKSVGKVGLQHLTALDKLYIEHCPKLILTQEGEGEGVGKVIAGDGPSFPPLPQTLRSLVLIDLPKLVNLPEWMKHLTSLQSLYISECKALESLPEWMLHLTSLVRLYIYRCSEKLNQRCCKSPGGQDWPIIQHIPHVFN